MKRTLLTFAFATLSLAAPAVPNTILYIEVAGVSETGQYQSQSRNILARGKYCTGTGQYAYEIVPDLANQNTGGNLPTKGIPSAVVAVLPVVLAVGPVLTAGLWDVQNNN